MKGGGHGDSPQNTDFRRFQTIAAGICPTAKPMSSEMEFWSVPRSTNHGGLPSGKHRKDYGKSPCDSWENSRTFNSHGFNSTLLVITRSGKTQKKKQHISASHKWDRTKIKCLFLNHRFRGLRQKGTPLRIQGGTCYLNINPKLKWKDQNYLQ